LLRNWTWGNSGPLNSEGVCCGFGGNLEGGGLKAGGRLWGFPLGPLPGAGNFWAGVGGPLRGLVAGGRGIGPARPMETLRGGIPPWTKAPKKPKRAGKGLADPGSKPGPRGKGGEGTAQKGAPRSLGKKPNSGPGPLAHPSQEFQAPLAGTPINPKAPRPPHSSAQMAGRNGAPTGLQTISPRRFMGTALTGIGQQRPFRWGAGGLFPFGRVGRPR